ncbi:MAG: ABC transporter ATP-binding protein [Myxococcota bacterium]
MSKKFQDDYLLSVRNVTKRYGDLRAVDDVSLDIVPGEIFALLGPNGAGKTTLIGCITGLITGFEGDIRMAGYDVEDDFRITRRLMGLVPQELNYDAFFNVREVLRFQAGYFGVDIGEERIDELLEQFSLADKAEDNTRWLSGGMKRRLMICKALMHDPVLIFLDEPTAGVDVELREELWEYVRDLRDAGTTIVLTTHYIEEAEELADRIGIINNGRLLRVSPRETLMDEFGSRKIEIQTASPIPEDFPSQFDDIEVQLEGDRTVSMVVEEKSIHQSDQSPVDRLIRAVVDAGIEIELVEGSRTSLEQIFREVVSSDNVDRDAGQGGAS